jgi:hypothetical protein
METGMSQISSPAPTPPPPRRSLAYYGKPPEIAHLRHSLVVEDAVIPGLRLMVMGYNCIKKAIGAAGTLPVCGPPKKIEFDNSKRVKIVAHNRHQFRIVSPHQYLQCSGVLSFNTSFDFSPRTGQKLPCQLIIGEEKALVTINNEGNTQILYFHLPDLEKPEDLPYWGVVDC